MSMYDKNHYNIVISLQLIKKKKRKEKKKNLKRCGGELEFSRWLQSHHRSSYERRERQKSQSQRCENTTLLALKMEEGAISQGIRWPLEVRKGKKV